MQIFLVIMTLLMPFVQPIVQAGADKMHTRMGIPAGQSQSVAMQPMMQQRAPAPLPPQYHFDGAKWYKYENGQVYVWTGIGHPSF